MLRCGFRLLTVTQKTQYHAICSLNEEKGGLCSFLWTGSRNARFIFAPTRLAEGGVWLGIFWHHISTTAPSLKPTPPHDDSKPGSSLHYGVTQIFPNYKLKLDVKGCSPKDFELVRQRLSLIDVKIRDTTRGQYKYVVRSIIRPIVATFLPAGYPKSVGNKYVEFAAWQAVTNFATTANGVLASTFMLYAVGLGHGAIPTAGAMNWVLKDGLGQLGTLLFGKAIAHNFDIHSKTWYFLSTIMLCVAIGLEITTILIPAHFLVMGSLANMVKGLSWMASGSTRSVFNLSFVRDNNIADITAKGTSQYILSSLFGTACGVGLCTYIGQSPTWAMACFAALTYMSNHSAYRTVRAIPLPTLNSTRLMLLCSNFLKCVATHSIGPTSLTDPTYMSYQREFNVKEEEIIQECALATPAQIAQQDSLLPWLVGDQRLLNPGIHVGASLEKVLGGDPNKLAVLLSTFRYSKYMLFPGNDAIYLILHVDAVPRDIVQGYLQAMMVRRRVRRESQAAPPKLDVVGVAELRILLQDTLQAALKLSLPFMQALKQMGWCTDKIVVEASRARAIW